MKREEIKNYQSLYWTFARLMLPRAHTITAISLLIAISLGSVFLVIGLIVWEIGRGNYNFFADWKDWIVNYWNLNLAPYWNIIRIIIAVSLPLVVGLLVFIGLMGLTALTVFYLIAFPKAILWWNEPDGLMCFGGQNGRLLWHSDTGFWTNRLASLPDRLLWWLAKMPYEPPEWSTEAKGQRTYLYISGPGAYIKCLIKGFNSDMDAHRFDKEYQHERNGLWETYIFGPETLMSPDGTIVAADSEPRGTIIPIGEIEESNKALINDGLTKTRAITKMSKGVAVIKEITGVAKELSDYDISKMKAERDTDSRIHIALWEELRREASNGK